MATGDIKFKLQPNGLVDMMVIEGDLLQDNGIETSVVIALFSDGLANPDDLIPDNTGDKRGWWGAYLLDTTSFFGSRLWLLSRSKITNDTLNEAKEYCEESLQYLIEFDIAESILVDVVRSSTLNEVLISIKIVRPNKESVSFKYYYNWESQLYRSI